MISSDAPRVWNLRDRKNPPPKGAVYIGRGTPWGNPYVGGKHGSRETVIRKFVEHVLPDLDVSSLRGKHLVCWCDPLPCHGHKIFAKANAPEGARLCPGCYVFTITSRGAPRCAHCNAR